MFFNKGTDITQTNLQHNLGDDVGWDGIVHRQGEVH